jgi:peptidoglycan-N-acetylglucosamine deacetylase
MDWLKSSYLGVAAVYIALDQKMAGLVYGRDVKHVMLLHIGGFQTIMLPQLIELLKRRDFKFITLIQAERDPAYESDPDLPLRHGGTLLEQMMEAKHLKLPPHTDKPYKKLESVCR